MKKALLVGVSEYPSTPLACSATDAQMLCNVLKEHGYKREILTNKKATPENILKAIASLSIKPYDDFLFYFSGHGCLSDTGGLLLACYPCVSLPAIWVHYKTEIEHVKRLFIYDCCHVWQNDNNEFLHNSKDTPIKPSFNSSTIGIKSNFTGNNSRKIIPALEFHSCAYRQYSYENSVNGLGNFTDAILQALYEATSFDSWHDLVIEKMKIKQSKQEPVMLGPRRATFPLCNWVK